MICEVVELGRFQSANKVRCKKEKASTWRLKQSGHWGPICFDSIVQRKIFFKGRLEKCITTTIRLWVQLLPLSRYHYLRNVAVVGKSDGDDLRHPTATRRFVHVRHSTQEVP